MIDIFTAKQADTNVTLALSEASISPLVSDCTIGTPLGDPENPPCARLVFTGQFSKVTAGSTEEASARKALFAKHPSFANYPPGHDFFVGKMELEEIWLIDFYGGASIISPADYYKAMPSAPMLELRYANAAARGVQGGGVTVAPKPLPNQTVATARWMADTLTWGVLTTVSSRSSGSAVGAPFGNPYSFAATADGTPYFYASDLDASMIDIFTAQQADTNVTLALSE